MITPSTSVEEIKQTYCDNTDNGQANKFLYKSCCLLIDKRFAEFVVKLVVFAVIGFSLYKLNTLDDCDKQQPYLALLTLLIGLLFPTHRLRGGGGE